MPDNNDKLQEYLLRFNWYFKLCLTLIKLKYFIKKIIWRITNAR